MTSHVSNWIQILFVTCPKYSYAFLQHAYAVLEQGGVIKRAFIMQNFWKYDLKLIDSKIAIGPKPATISGSFHKKSPQQDFLRSTLTAAGPRDSSAC